MENKPIVYVIAKGGNMPETEFWLKESDRLMSEFGEILVETPIIKTKAEGFPGPDFLNSCILFSTQLLPQSLLSNLQTIEKLSGRNKKFFRTQYESRIIDLDIIRSGNLKYNSKTLQIPHPQASKRSFVVQPVEWLIGNGFLKHGLK